MSVAAIKPWRELTRQQREEAYGAEAALLAAPSVAWRDEGWHLHELPGRVIAAARAMNVITYPTQVRRVVDQTRSGVAHRRDWRPGGAP